MDEWRLEETGKLKSATALSETPFFFCMHADNYHCTATTCVGCAYYFIIT